MAGHNEPLEMIYIKSLTGANPRLEKYHLVALRALPLGCRVTLENFKFTETLKVDLHICKGG